MTTHLTGLTSKREGNCNAMVTCWLCDLDIESSFASNRTSNIFHPKILHTSFSTFDLPYIDLDITSYTSTLALPGKEVLRIAYKPLPIKQNAWAQAYKDYLQINAFPDLVVVKQEGSPHALQKKATRGAAVSNERDGWLNAARLDSWDVNISFYCLFCVAEVRLPCMVETAEGRRSRRNSR